MIEQERQALEFPPKERFPAADISVPYFEKCVGGQKAPLPCPQLKCRSRLPASLPTLPLKLLLLTGDGSK